MPTMSTKDLTFPTEFTLEQLQKLRELAMRENTSAPSPLAHNLGVKLSNYTETAQERLRLRLAS